MEVNSTICLNSHLIFFRSINVIHKLQVFVYSKENLLKNQWKKLGSQRSKKGNNSDYKNE